MRRILFILSIFLMSCSTSLLHKSAQVILQDEVGQDVGYGSAFAINKDMMLSAAHVCEMFFVAANYGITPQFTVRALDNNNQMRTVSDVMILAMDKDNDICLLGKKNHGLKINHLNLDESYDIGDEITIVGYPAGYGPIMTHGYIFAKQLGVAPYTFGSSAGVYGGNSGGPTFNEYGDIIGILVMGHPKYPNISLSVRGKVIKAFLEKHNVEYQK